ncbi:hypothetical protein ASPZODRAFT_131767 [Penicilliopsis zonata CBS 506.65]|uniref:Uncharacterized protein n=1 Tax=Penicilliopsis zonata CBS 506.65 TaxID=1073090 RepID=A0A1L9SI26_9EURO|nr:hypothetical protein ASPZODRAFT_131767 [Penicilliopsis zonata CBS 506.65]OJJ46869.1 hypothetical protein ASPZODRAFT_131767 [Penicilliopsis zonata CBS 506.65]
MSVPGLTVIGAQVTAATVNKADEKDTPNLSTLPSTHSNLSAEDNPAIEFDPCVGAKPCSPFYRHATITTQSVERLTVQPKLSNGDYNMPQVESGENTNRSQSFDISNADRARLWKDKRRNRSWLRSLSKKQKLTVKIVIAIVTVGTMIAIALGITAAVGGGVWKSHHQQGTLR